MVVSLPTRLFWSAACAVAAIAWACAPLAQEVPAGNDIVVLGEVHDNPAHHRIQAEIVARLQPTALVFEMLTPGQAQAAEGVARGDMAALAAALRWSEGGWPDFAMYHPIFEAAPDAVILGAALPFADLSRAADTGAAAVFGPDGADWGLGPLPEADLTRRAAAMQESHCNALPADILPGMVEVQRLRDAHFARVAAEAFDRLGGPVVIITGTGHARRDEGIPHMLVQGRPDLSVWSLGQFEDGDAPDAPFDTVMFSPAAARDDPCAAF